MKNIFIHLGFIFILIGCSIICIDKVSASINNYYNDVNKSNEIVESVNNNYTEFKEKSLNVKNGIVEVSKSYNLYLEEFPKVNQTISTKVKQVEETINSLSTTTDSLLESCQYDLNNSVMKNQCNSFKINFRNMMNSYDEMIIVYNNVINTYNEYSLRNGKEQIEEYKGNLDASIVAANGIIE